MSHRYTWKDELRLSAGFVGCLCILVVTIFGCVQIGFGAAYLFTTVKSGMLAVLVTCLVPLWALGGVFAFNMMMEWGTRP